MGRCVKAELLHAVPTRGLRGRHSACLAALLSLAAFLLASAPALAADQTYVELGPFASEGTGDGELVHPRRVAVDPGNGDVYVADRDNDRIVVFRPGPGQPPATYLTQFGSGQLDQPFGVAIDPASGDVYVSSSGNDRIVKFESDGAATPTFTVDPGFTSPALGTGAAQVADFEADVAVDPTNGNLLVADAGANLIKRFSSSGAHLANIDGSSTPQGIFQGLLDIDVAPDGTIFAVDSTGPLVVEGEEVGGGGPEICTGNFYCPSGNTSRTVSLNPDGSGGATVVAPNAESTNLYGLVAYDPANDQVLLANVNPQAALVDTYRADGSGFLARFGRGPFAPITGLAVGGPETRAYMQFDRTRHQNFEEDVGFVGLIAYRPANLPSVAAPVVTNIGPESADASVVVNPNGEPTAVIIEYTRYGSWETLPEQAIGSGTAPVTVEGELLPLAPNAEYRVRATARNSGGAETTGPEVTFNTVSPAPFAYSGGAAPRAETTARLTGWVNPRNNETTYYFEYGPTTSYGTTLQSSSAGGGEEQLPVSAELDGLTPGATYHFRLVAESAAGTTHGDDRAFTTRTAAEGGPRPRGIELLNSPEKGNQVAQPPMGGVVANANATKILWTTTAGAPGGSTGTGNTFMAERSADGWHSRSLLPSADQLIDNGESKYAPKLASPSFDDILYEISSGILTSPPRKFATLSLGMDQRYLGELEAANTPGLVRANDDFSHVYATANTSSGIEQLFDVAADPPTLVSVLEDGEAADCGVTIETGYAQFAGFGYEWNATDPDAPARVFFETPTDPGCDGTESLFMRDLDAGTTTLISGPALPGGPQGEDGAFARASADGSEVIFTSTSRLAPEDTNEVGDIYRYEIGVGKTCLTCVGRGAGADVGSSWDRPVIVSRDLSRIYFESYNRLVPGVGDQGVTEPGSGPSAFNLYAWHDGQIDYVGSTKVFGQRGSELLQRSATLADGGRTLFFISFDPDITTDEVGESRQIFRYSERDHSLECVTCVAGATQTEGSLLLDRFEAGINQVAEDGNAMVFQTKDRLIAADVNGDSDIYEWRNGRVALVTDGVTQYPEGTGQLSLTGIGEDGTNVIFQAGVNLTGYERDNAGQMYVARVGGGFPPPLGQPAPCGEESCQGPLRAPPPLGAPGSATAVGPGNAKPTRKKPAKQCRKKAGKGKSKAKKGCAKQRGGKGKKKSQQKSANRKQGGNR